MDPMEGENPTVEETAIEAPVDSPDAGTDTPEVDWQKRYQDTQAWATQQAQEAAELRQHMQRLESDPEALAELLDKHGYEIPDDSGFDLDEVTALNNKIAALESRFEQTASEAEDARKIAAWQAQEASVFSQLGSQRGYPLTDKEQNALRRQAVAIGVRDDGLLPFEEAYAELNAIREEDQKRWATSKRPTHRVSANGQPASKRPERATHDQRVANMLEALSANE